MSSASRHPADALDPTLAERIAQTRLAERFPTRWQHTIGVAAVTAGLLPRLPLSAPDADLALAAAWLHDVGYARSPALYAWHPLDGAFLLNEWGYPQVANLVAWHTTAGEEAALKDADGLYVALLAGFPREESLIADLLTYADMTTGPDGTPCTFARRLVDVRARHGANSLPARAMENAWPRMTAAAQRLQTALTAE